MSAVGAKRKPAIGGRPGAGALGLLGRALLSPAAVPLAGAVGIGATGLAFGLARTGGDGHLPSLLLWLGLLLILAPPAAHLLAERTEPSDRVLLVGFTALATYAVKVLHDPSGFGFSDEYIHLSATQQLQVTHNLFAAIPVAGSSVATDYPGLHAATVALSDITALPLFTSGVIVIALARLILMVALFLLFEQVSGSARVAGIGALLYAAGPNFLYFTAQFSYESLSLPLFVAALAIAATLPESRNRDRLQPLACTVLLTLAITMTHHLTSYALAATFAALTVMAIRPRWRATRAGGLAVLAIASPAAWFVVAATGTGAYLGFTFHRTLDAITDIGETGARKPFQASGDMSTPILERGLAFASAAIVCIGILVALRDLRRRRAPLSPPTALLVVGSLAFLVLFPLKVLPGAWETANRSSDFLFIGVAFVLAGLLATRAAAARRPRLCQTSAVALMTAVICGGVIQGWPSQLRLASSTEVEAAGATISAPGVAASRWAITNLPANAVYLADEATGRELAVRGVARVYPGRAIEAPPLFEDPTLPLWQHDLLLREHIGFVVLDRRKLAANNLAGYFLQRASSPDGGFGFYDPAVRAKYLRIARSREVYDNGDIVIFDIRGLAGERPPCASVSDRTWSETFACDAAAGSRWYGADVDHTVRMPGARIDVVATRIEQRVDGTHVTVRLLILNTGRGVVVPDRNGRGISLSVAGDHIRRREHKTGRDDDLSSRTRIPPRRQIGRSVTFVLNARQATALRDGGGVLRIWQPGNDPDRYDVGFVHVAPPFESGTR